MSGSPPRLWGRRLAFAVAHPGRRFTPTCVGTTGDLCGLRRDRPVHPHVCGDDSGAASGGGVSPGSPPRVWGRPRRALDYRWPQRFTPTCVGTTCAIDRKPRIAPVHPHVCGDDSANLAGIVGRYGSPPRVWGRPLGEDGGHADDRFTPTCVGTTLAPRAAPAPSAVHPHVCGDDVDHAHYELLRSGSPPRVWGRRE